MNVNSINSDTIGVGTPLFDLRPQQGGVYFSVLGSTDDKIKKIKELVAEKLNVGVEKIIFFSNRKGKLEDERGVEDLIRDKIFLIVKK